MGIFDESQKYKSMKGSINCCQIVIEYVSVVIIIQLIFLLFFRCAADEWLRSSYWILHPVDEAAAWVILEWRRTNGCVPTTGSFPSEQSELQWHLTYMPLIIPRSDYLIYINSNPQLTELYTVRIVYLSYL